MEKESTSKAGSSETKIDSDTEWLSLRDCFTKALSEADKKHSKPTIHRVPKDMAAASPHSFTPQSISIGPYHRGKPELHAMERYKVAAAREFHAEKHSKFEEWVTQNTPPRLLRDCYDSPIDCRDEKLLWLVTLDAGFLLRFLQFYAGAKDSVSVSEVKDVAVSVSVLKDVFKLENQIPLLAMKTLLELQHMEVAEQKQQQPELQHGKVAGQKQLEDILARALVTLSPLAPADMSKSWAKAAMSMRDRIKEELPSCEHLLEALYFSIVHAKPSMQGDAAAAGANQGTGEDEQEPKSQVIQTLSKVFQVLSSIRVKGKSISEWLSSLKIVPDVIKRLMAKGNQVPPVASNSVEIGIPPSRDEIAVRSVSELQKAGVRFVAANPRKGIRGVSFNRRNGTLSLPPLRIGAHTEVVLRNLIAYEACSSGRRDLTRFVDFVNGIVDTGEDVQTLRKCGVLQHCLQSDVEVANLCNGMGACVHLTYVDYLDHVVHELNVFYGRTWSVKLMDALDSYLAGSWQMLSLIAALLLLALTFLEAFCSVYECRKWLDPSAFKSS